LKLDANKKTKKHRVVEICAYQKNDNKVGKNGILSPNATPLPPNAC
jgi:hypothetical protein